MPITLKTKTVFHCVCIRKECRHEWDALTKPMRCAKCKYRSWNGEDHRFLDPYDGVPVPSQIRTGSRPPQQPGHEALLDLLTSVRIVVENVILGYPEQRTPCNHKGNDCICAEKELLARLDERIEQLNRLRPKRSTYLTKKGSGKK